MKYFYQELKKKSILLFIIGLMVNPVTSWGADPVTTELENKESNVAAPKLVEEVPHLVLEEPVTTRAAVPPSPTQTLGIGLRLDGAYSGGGAVYQGFSIPSIRISGFGNIGKYLNYRLSLGQTREFSTATLPQLLPVEAFVVFNVRPEDGDSVSNLKVKAGLFSPSFNPLWTPDLTYVNMPDFNETHRALFLSREAGAEIIYEPFKNYLELAMGAFNGTGVFAQNTNNSKAFTAYLKISIPIGSDCIFSLGTGNYILKQSNEGSVNYKSVRVSDGFAGIEILSLKTKLMIDAFTSQFDDSVKGINPSGGSVVFNLGLGRYFGLFAKYEFATKSPVLTGKIRQLQGGPEFYFDENVKAFVTYGELETGGTIDRSMMIRLRLSI